MKNASNNDSSIQGDDASSLLAARVRITNASAEAKERANLLASGELCCIADVTQGVQALLEVLKENLFAIPARVAEQIAGHSSDDSREIYRIVEQAIYAQMRATIKSGEAISVGMAASAARGETYSVVINPNNLGNEPEVTTDA